MYLQLWPGASLPRLQPYSVSADEERELLRSPADYTGMCLWSVHRTNRDTMWRMEGGGRRGGGLVVCVCVCVTECMCSFVCTCICVKHWKCVCVLVQESPWLWSSVCTRDMKLRAIENKCCFIQLTVRCWNSHALMMLVATLGKIPLFLLRFFSLSGSSSSPVLGEATLLSRPSPVTWQETGRDSGDQTHSLFTSCIRCASTFKGNKYDFEGILEGFVCTDGGV